MKKIIILAAMAAVMVTMGVSAQERRADPPSTETTQSVSLNIPQGASLHYAYEHPLGRLTTFVGRVGVEGGAMWGYDWFDFGRTCWMVIPTIDIESRFYYGLDRRAVHGRSTQGNAGSFLALQMKNAMPFGYISDSRLTLHGATWFTPMWGMRRVWADHWLFEFTTGASFGWGWAGGFRGSSHINVRFGYSF